MKSFSVADAKTQLSSILKEVEAGHEIAITYGKRKETIAVIMPYSAYITSKKRKLGTLKGKMKVKFERDFSLSDHELVFK
jgi:prevent-host-death family protein